MRTLVVWLMLFSPLAWSSIDVYQFGSDEEEQRFQVLTSELRCPKCQNQNIADSDAPIAKDLRAEVARMVNEGAADTEVIEFMQSRYGDFVLYRPKINSQTWFLWYGPYLLLGLGVLVILLVVFTRRIKSKHGRAAGVSGQELTAEQQQALDSLLDQEKQK